MIWERLPYKIFVPDYSYYGISLFAYYVKRLYYAIFWVKLSLLDHGQKRIIWSVKLFSNIKPAIVRSLTLGILLESDNW